MKETPLVSICCLTYNHVKYIRDAIEGFLIQKTNFPIEVLIHDDASTDGTADIVKEYETKHPNIIKPIYQTENQWSKGIKPTFEFNFPRALGKYIALCEGDDYWTYPYKLQKQVDFLEKNREYSATAHRCYFKNEITNKHGYFGSEKERIVYLKELLDYRHFHTASIVFQKHIIDKYFKDSSMQGATSGDKLINISCGISGPIMYFARPMATYRRNEGGLSSGKIKDTKKFLNNNLRVYSSLKKHLPLRYYSQLKYFETSKLNLIPNKASKKDKVLYYLISVMYSLPFFKRNLRKNYEMTTILLKNLF